MRCIESILKCLKSEGRCHMETMRISDLEDTLYCMTVLGILKQTGIHHLLRICLDTHSIDETIQILKAWL